MQRLDCTVNNYAWGKKGSESEVANIFAAGHENFKVSPSMPYAELWMGTHPDGPARVRDSSVNLSKFIAKNDSESGKDEIHLPFIMKIMSIKHSLSLQVHPTKEQAEYLHAKDPINYPDRHHKPELAYALTKFELLCGFRPAVQILQNLEAFPELAKIMGETETKEFKKLIENGHKQDSKEMKEALKHCFSKMLYSQIERPSLVEEQLKSFYNRLESGIRGALIEETIPVLESMRKHFPGDVGCFSPLYLNHMILQPGECCFYAAEELHAYLSGECVECVGCSNNTIRAALTPKFIDREALINVLNYRMTEPEFYLVPPQKLKNYPNVTEYAPDCKDFILHEIQISKPLQETSLNAIDSKTILPSLKCGSILVIVEGAALCKYLLNERNVKRGDIFYIAPGQSIQISPTSDQFLGYRTFSYENGPNHSFRKFG